MTNRSIFEKVFTQDIIDKVWEKGEIVPDVDPNIIRKDKCGAMIKKELYGQSASALSMAWEIDHIKPKKIGGTDEISNLQPLQWENNRYKGDNYPSWDCKVIFKITENINIQKN